MTGEELSSLAQAVVDGQLSVDDLREAWRLLDGVERVDGFRLLSQASAEEFFNSLSSKDQLELVQAFAPGERRLWIRSLAPDDAADLVQEAPPENRPSLMESLDEPTRREVRMLLAYAEDDAGGLMSPRYARVRPEMSVDEAIIYLRKQARLNLETIYYGYVLDPHQKLLGVVSFRDLFQAKGAESVSEVMNSELISVPEDMDQEAVGQIFAEHDLVALPVLDAEGLMKGIVTVDDIVDVVQEEATEDIHKMGGTEALEAPYLEVSFLEMLKKRGGWLVVLFLAQMMTVAVMAHYATTLEQVSVLAMFIPLIISSGGNSGSQASTLVIRAMSLDEVRLSDWVRVMSREVAVGIGLGLILAGIGLARIVLWPGASEEFGSQFVRIGLTISCSLLAVVLWGTFIGSMLPLILRRIGLDPASASAPLVATLVDVMGIAIYFNVAIFWLSDAMA